MQTSDKFLNFSEAFDGEFHRDKSTRLIYATDASAYKMLPLAVAYPKNESDIKKLIFFANKEKLSLIPRAAGTSLAGQVVGDGIVVDISKYFTEILELNVAEKWVRVQPGVILDELNLYLKDYDLFFGPETSTASRCMIGGMLGNNSCGSHSLIYGSTRDHTLEVKTILSDGSNASFSALSDEDFHEKCQPKGTTSSLEKKIYQHIKETLENTKIQDAIRSEFPDTKNHRRNTGYALDLLLDSSPFSKSIKNFNFCKLLAGSEGTLAFTTEIKLDLVPSPPKEVALICAHFTSLEEAMQGNLIALKYKPGAVELMDDTILKLSENNPLQAQNRFFLKDKPGAILIIEFARESQAIINELAQKMEAELTRNNLGYHFPIITGSENIKRVWDLRKSALGVLSNLKGNAKPVSVIEDTSVLPEILPEYIAEFKTLLQRHNLSCVFHAHIGSGEIHLRPILNLKQDTDREKFHTIALDTAKLVKKFKGSLSGEHGDGRLRGEFIPLMMGEINYQTFKDIKAVWDPNTIFNPEKIVNTPKMNSHLRYTNNQETKEPETYFDFSADGGMIKATERCNGSGDCRNTILTGKNMCPSYQASLDEKNTTRARANLLREFLSYSKKKNIFDSKEVYDILDLCLSCKACKSECPSNVDMAKLKAEFLQHYYECNGIPLRTRLIANISQINQLGAIAPKLYNYVNQHPKLGGFIKKQLGFAQKRNIPTLHKTTLRSWYKKKGKRINGKGKTVYFFADEFTNFNDTSVGIKAILLLEKLGYEVIIPKHHENGRTYLSKGLVKKAQVIANKNISLLKDIISKETPLVGIEPSAILSFRDEYKDLAYPDLKTSAMQLSENCLMIEEFLWQEMQAGRIIKEQFTKESKEISFHGHCYQKALASTLPVKEVLSFPENYTATEIDSGCCGMAGSFGYEAEHYDLSMKIAELKLLPAIRNTKPTTLLAASGTSCRHQIKDGSQREAQHPVEILFDALVTKI
ncbi:FAD-binding and (Fe-S)-binding domain-containing protein [Ancylomarina sp. 16SWW S1-10-2]|uniref:FAD-binding and (Fe-S)-binding domain-containing protein n=1 Tax=Ancylomarina sp. 16SWW S1-10-2 TaxID=2499681 RepID=UPI0012AE7143|nr:FAD-binding and (Fe-S)-binding domain-containing protein [Ancylomarina sp. 16SWW S1-10-2]MRT92934.1 FAD-binding oxidoreductase [Ancylomarina sp. 16SWW S1-10-2]